MAEGRMTTHAWSREDDMFDRCSRCGLVQGVLYEGHYTDPCSGREASTSTGGDMSGSRHRQPYRGVDLTPINNGAGPRREPCPDCDGYEDGHTATCPSLDSPDSGRKATRSPDPCRRFAAYLTVQGRRIGVEVERRRWPRYVEVRLLTPSRTRLWTHRG